MPGPSREANRSTSSRRPFTVRSACGCPPDDWRGFAPGCVRDTGALAPQIQTCYPPSSAGIVTPTLEPARGRDAAMVLPRSGTFGGIAGELLAHGGRDFNRPLYVLREEVSLLCQRLRDLANSPRYSSLDWHRSRIDGRGSPTASRAARSAANGTVLPPEHQREVFGARRRVLPWRPERGSVRPKSALPASRFSPGTRSDVRKSGGGECHAGCRLRTVCGYPALVAATGG